MSAPLTERQTQVFRFILAFMRENGKPPTIQEIGRGLHIKSTNGVHKMIVALEAKGAIRRTPNEARGIEIVGQDDPYGVDDEPSSVPWLKVREGAGRGAHLLSSAEAEHPLLRSRRQVLVDPALLPDRVDLDACLAVVAGDDGMNGHGIRKNDLVIVEEADGPFHLGGRPLPNGTLVAVLIHDRLVLRQFEFANHRLHFRAADRSYTDDSAHPTDEEFFIVGRALAVMRRL